MKYLTLLAICLIAACATIREYNTVVKFPVQTKTSIEVKQLRGGDLNVRAYAELYPDGKCIIYLRQYPQCLSHEVRHCLEGNWHEGRKSEEGC